MYIPLPRHGKLTTFSVIMGWWFPSEECSNKGGRNCTFTLRNLIDRYFSQMIKVNVNSKVMWMTRTVDVIWWGWHFTSVVFLSKAHNFSLLLKNKNQANLNCGTFCEMNQYSLKLSKSLKTRKIWKTVIGNRSIRRRDESM